jgi:Tfp pilus assembly protein PilZ
MAVSEDISEGGVFVRTAIAHQTGDQVKVVFKTGLLRRLTLRARVCWNRGNPPSGLGLAFEFDDEGQRERVRALVREWTADSEAV